MDLGAGLWCLAEDEANPACSVGRLVEPDCRFLEVEAFLGRALLTLGSECGAGLAWRLGLRCGLCLPLRVHLASLPAFVRVRLAHRLFPRLECSGLHSSSSSA